MADLRYPIGELNIPENISEDYLKECIEDIRTTPTRMARALEGLSDKQLDTPYRPEGWTVRQLAHHVPDSHMHSYIRFHWALTEDNPLIKVYNERDWAALSYTQAMPVDVSLNMLTAIHVKLVALIESLTDSDLAKTFQHPEYGQVYSLRDIVVMYAWHGNHHIAHITALRERMGW